MMTKNIFRLAKAPKRLLLLLFFFGVHVCEEEVVAIFLSITAEPPYLFFSETFDDSNRQQQRDQRARHRHHRDHRGELPSFESYRRQLCPPP